jgi:hypothetical protein
METDYGPERQFDGTCPTFGAPFDPEVPPSTTLMPDTLQA